MAMTMQDYYGTLYPMLESTRLQLMEQLENIRAQKNAQTNTITILYLCSRIKSPQSMEQKLKKKNLSNCAEALRGTVYDAVGLRAVCSFTEDIYHLVEKLRQNPLFTIEEERDYLTAPKPNGYRSYHLRIRMNSTAIPAELQLRTIAMDFWAALEHQLRYKKETSGDVLIADELRRCADEIASTDLTMQTLRELCRGDAPWQSSNE